MQPTFCPWIGYFMMIARVDAFVFLDCVQFEKQSWQSRNKIKVDDKAFLISLHLQKAPLSTLIKDMRLCGKDRWKKVLLRTLWQNYQKSPNFKEIYEILDYALFHFENLSKLNIFLIQKFAHILGLQTPFITASSLPLSPFAKRESLLLEICNNLKASKYLSPEGSRIYLDKVKARALFENAGIDIEYFTMNHPIYHQQGKDFVEYLSIIDLLFNETKAPQILTQTALSADSTGGGGVTFLFFAWLEFTRKAPLLFFTTFHKLWQNHHQHSCHCQKMCEYDLSQCA